MTAWTRDFRNLNFFGTSRKIIINDLRQNNLFFGINNFIFTNNFIII